MYWQSGIDWSETYEKAILMSDVIEMLYGNGHPDMAQYILSQRLARPPGSQVEYSSGDSVLMAYLLKRVYPADEYKNLIENKIKKPLGLTNFMMEKDASGTFVGSSYLYASVEDMVNFAQLYLNHGVLKEQKILDPDFIDRVTHRNPHFSYQKNHNSKGDLIEGGQWWINQSANPEDKTLPWPEWPADTFAAEGHWGQTLVIVPSKKLIFVRTGDDRIKEKFDAAKLGPWLKKMGVL
jgi:CubicO group peptidase (beta-lactamase class C family)